MPGISESRAISNGAVAIAAGLMEEHFEPQSHELFSWGSVARREMGPYSDLDFVIASRQPDLARIAKYEQELSAALSAHYLDILGKHTPQELLHIAKIDGTDRQALLYMRDEQHRNSDSIMTDSVSQIRTDSKNNLREIFHILANLEFVYPKLFGQGNLKFGPGRMKDLNFAFLLSRFESSDLVSDIPSALINLKGSGHISEEITSASIQRLDTLMYLRNRTQEISGTYHTILTPELYGSLGEILGIPANSISEMLKESSSTVRSLYQQLKKVAIGLAKTHTESNTSELVDKIITTPEEIIDRDVNRILGSNNEILMMLLSYTTKNPEILEQLRKTNPSNWYVLYGIANNTNTSESTLMRLMVPDDDRQDLVNLYTDFAWRNIYLYAAKNPSSTAKVRDHILHYKNARPMDIEAASKIK